ncbi:MAG: hypothetical protein KBT33_11580 [Prevotellaceae bacterium]|nr:hypothetical protein [Candidatus Minthosoma equi]
MKKLLLIAAVILGCTTASAQKTLNLSTYSGTNLSQYDGKTLNISVNRQLFKGWNTISLPFDMSAEQVEAAFGSDCKLEALVGAEDDGMQLKLNFKDCKSEGIKANIPYILYYTGETATKKFTTESAICKDEPATVSFTTLKGVKVTFTGAQKQTEAKGLYGILARDNTEAAFVNVDDITSGFYATRCYVELSNGNSTVLQTNHISDDVTSVKSVVKAGESVDVYNISGTKVANKIHADKINSLPAGIYVVKNKKVLVR